MYVYLGLLVCGQGRNVLRSVGDVQKNKGSAVLCQNVLMDERGNDPCSNPEFELNNHIDYARHSCFSALGSKLTK